MDDSVNQSALPQNSEENTALGETKLPRVGFYTNSEKTAILWDRFKSADGRETMREIIKREAEKLGMIPSTEPGTTGPRESLFTTDDVFATYNAAVSVGVSTFGRLPPSIGKALEFSDAEIALVNAHGQCDRLLKKYLGDFSFKYRDEIMVGLMLGQLAIAKALFFKSLVQQYAGAGQTEAAKTARPQSVIECERHGRGLAIEGECPVCRDERLKASA